MAICPKCRRNSLEYNDARKSVWCLYVGDCGFEDLVDSYENYRDRFGDLKREDEPARKAASAK